MKFKHSIVTLMALGTLMSPLSLVASDFDWSVSLNLRSHSDPHGYRYGLVNRFGMQEPQVIYILDSVYEPADAYMILRLCELSGRPPEYVLRIYRERRHLGWHDIAYYLGIHADSNDFILLRRHHDLHERYYDSRRKERYEEYYRVPERKPYYVPHSYSHESYRKDDDRDRKDREHYKDSNNHRNDDYRDQRDTHKDKDRKPHKDDPRDDDNDERKRH